jgi:hypothetical protein
MFNSYPEIQKIRGRERNEPKVCAGLNFVPINTYLIPLGADATYFISYRPAIFGFK